MGTPPATATPHPHLLPLCNPPPGPLAATAAETRGLLAEEAAGSGLGPSSDDFWLLVAALRDFAVRIRG
jgi:hypothetical protein